MAIDLSSSGSSAGTVAAGDTIRVTARGRIDGLLGILAYDRVLDAVWRSSDPTVAEVSRSAVRRDSLGGPPQSSQMIVRGIRPGTAHVTVSARGVVGDMLVRVVAGELSPRR